MQILYTLCSNDQSVRYINDTAIGAPSSAPAHVTALNITAVIGDIRKTAKRDAVQLDAYFVIYVIETLLPGSDYAYVLASQPMHDGVIVEKSRPVVVVLLPPQKKLEIIFRAIRCVLRGI